jgi:hypothetical protein
MYISMRFLFLGIICIVTSLYYLIFRKEKVQKWGPEFKLLIYLGLAGGIFAIIDSFIPLNMPR